MTQDEKQAVALMRYSVIAPLVTCASGTFQSERDFFTAAAEKSYLMPDGTMRQFSRDTIYRWHRFYLKDGFDRLQKVLLLKALQRYRQ